MNLNYQFCWERIKESKSAIRLVTFYKNVLYKSEAFKNSYFYHLNAFYKLQTQTKSIFFWIWVYLGMINYWQEFGLKLKNEVSQCYYKYQKCLIFSPLLVSWSSLWYSGSHHPKWQLKLNKNWQKREKQFLDTKSPFL